MKERQALSIALALAMLAYTQTNTVWRALERRGLIDEDDLGDPEAQGEMIAELIAETLGLDTETMELLDSIVQSAQDLLDFEKFRKLIDVLGSDA